ncbi:tetratricopeptide (TPR) repeat protein [Pedobacter sp. AK017]|uniref:RagB/SusD family nutrient uptake outer membrane protein n=1 Tax=Pedobacter sp. AK017 TaxID=2723073 RepID=UPI00160CDBF4|nr:RagB/SusD family nutrient uptake outer membrane protein [Pedobacter sp. AK017]MBB5440660.1 tetratricopeptide (TPR) repeat protein [Pedobacter sp. AK017]
MKKYLKLATYFLLGFCTFSCKKEKDFLSAKPNDALTVPNSLYDYELILNDEDNMNANEPMLGFISGEEFTVSLANMQRATQTQRNAYTWGKDNFYENLESPEWGTPYKRIYVANVVIDGLKTLKISKNEQTKYNAIKGRALFFRAWNFKVLLDLFTLPYVESSAEISLGIPLRLNSNLNIKSSRPNLKDSYNQVISDLREAILLLPDRGLFPTQPSKGSCYALLAKIFLTLGKYDEALKYSNECIGIYPEIMDYNSFETAEFSFTTQTEGYLPEIIFHVATPGASFMSLSRLLVDPALYEMFDNEDLRKTMFFHSISGGKGFKGSYDLKFLKFSGIAVDEVYLIRAECYARIGEKALAIKDINSLLVKRYKKGAFIEREVSSNEEALALVLIERRKELCFRGIRWSDLRRLNLDPKLSVNLSRQLNNVVYTLPANDKRYSFPIPELEIQASGIQQNER